jgi:hypothetical protein
MRVLPDGKPAAAKSSDGLARRSILPRPSADPLTIFIVPLSRDRYKAAKFH